MIARCWLLAGVVLLACCGARAQHLPRHAARQITFNSDPPRASLTIHCSAASVQGLTAGTAGEPMTLVLPPGRHSIGVTYRHEGCEEVSRSYYVEFGRDPSPLVFEAVTLPASSWATHVRRHPVLVALVLLAGAGALFGFLLPRVSRARRAVKRSALLKELHGPSSDPNVGRQLGRWRLLERIGAGGMSTVYRAVPDDTLDLQEAVAIKIIDPQLAREPAFHARFQREVNACRALSHASIVRIIDWNDDGGVLYIVMELVRGETLRRSVRPGGIPLLPAVKLARDMAEGLTHAHERGLVHRDLKPENVVVEERGRARIMDFGLARRSGEVLTAPGRVLGTPGYMAPEQIRGEELDERTDEYALGVILFELLAGRGPVNASDTAALLYRHQSGEPLPSVSTFRPDLPAAVATVIDRMLARTPSDRYPTVREAFSALEQAAGRPPGPSGRPSG